MVKKDQYGRTETFGFRFYVRSWYREVFGSLPADINGYPTNGKLETLERQRVLFNQAYPDRTFEDRLWKLLPEQTSTFQKLQTGDKRNQSTSNENMMSASEFEAPKESKKRKLEKDDPENSSRKKRDYAASSSIPAQPTVSNQHSLLSEEPLINILIASLANGMNIRETDKSDNEPHSTAVGTSETRTGSHNVVAQDPENLPADHESRCPDVMALEAPVGPDGRIIGWGPDPSSVAVHVKRFQDSGITNGTIIFDSPPFHEDEENRIPDDWLSSHALMARMTARAKRAEEKPTEEALYYARFGVRILGYNGPLGNG
ncbi:hypothetical protein IAQ61_003937 [Plenodomus lingam]|uniref:uncharacterized protein n=1 Tax=Leptosphaeria maculans TaxID=5022 RepID=UPI003329A8E6|nr:hypothetical protein IAQ61_003937 [Plenodomus lingam]